MGTSKRRHKRFNRTPGRHSIIAKRRYARGNAKVLMKLTDTLQTKVSKPYKLRHCVRIVNGQATSRLVVSRLQKYSVKGRKLLSVVHPQKPKIYIHSSDISPDGYRMFNVNLLHQAITDVVQHTITCIAAQKANLDGQPPISKFCEKLKSGMASSFQFTCVCGKSFNLENTNSVDLPNGDACPDINLRAVWGSMVTGGGSSRLNEMFGTLNAPGISDQKYAKIEHAIGNTSMWNHCLEEDMLAAGIEERNLAIERGDFHDGVPAITVICDGGWSKRTHKHTYNALGGIGVIFGAATGKLLHIGVRNKHCYICNIAESRNEDPKEHECFRNWTSSSQSTEADVILEGFLNAETTHGVRYMRLIAGGDSSVFATIQDNVPVWGRAVSKLECANHICKCLRSSLEKLVVDKPAYKGKGRLTKFMRIRLTTAVRCAIRLRSNENDKHKAARQLEHDVRNSVHHIFGNHSHCSDFCKSKSPSEKPRSSNTETDQDVNEDMDTVCDVINEQQSMWLDGSSEKDMEDSRYGASSEVSLETDMLSDISILLDRIASKSKRLLGNFTTNLAESWMAIRAKFDGGKVYNRCNRGSWHARCYGGALRKNFGPAWSPIVWQKCTSSDPGTLFTNVYRLRSRQLMHSILSKSKPDVQARKRKRKRISYIVSNTKKAKRSYGTDAVDVVPDLAPGDLEATCKDFLTTRVLVDDVRCTQVEQETRDQSNSTTWQNERKLRLTASNFGEVVRRNPKLQVAPLVSRLLYSSFRGTRFTRFGLQAEFPTIKEYIEKKRENQEIVKVEKIGFVIDQKNKYLGATSDGRVVPSTGPCGLLEIKNLLQKNNLSLMEAAKTMKTFCLEIVNGRLQLKRNHNYYYQCQGQLNVIKMPWLDFVVRRTNPNQIHIERIERDEKLWSSVMVPKLQAFYMKAILPELSNPREKTSTGIREPDRPWFDSSSQGKQQQQARNPTAAEQPRNQTAATPPTDDGSSYPASPKPGPSGINTRTRKTCHFLTPPTDKGSPGSPKPGPSGVKTRTRKTCQKFVGRRILHEWCEDDTTKATKWYKGTVLDVLKGKDGQAGALYEVLYDGDSEPYELENLHQDFIQSSLKFIDI